MPTLLLNSHETPLKFAIGSHHDFKSVAKNSSVCIVPKTLAHAKKVSSEINNVPIKIKLHLSNVIFLSNYKFPLSLYTSF